MRRPQKVYKYPIEPIPGVVQETTIPQDATIVHAAAQEQLICLWAQVDPLAPPGDRGFQVVGTGQDIPNGATHRGTVHMQPFVWHVYELDG